VAVAGLPEPRADHAIVMAKFARECMKKMNEVTKRLEVSLGPETGDLTMRFGLHSGPVTAGVLRGEKSRFQLFGDTVNTAARMESTGIKNRIQCSQDTADLLRNQGKERWLEEREEGVIAKGKGQLKTYWICLKDNTESKSGSVLGTSDDQDQDLDDVFKATDEPKSFVISPKNHRLAGWISELLLISLKQLVASRPHRSISQEERLSIARLEQSFGRGDKTVLEETPSYVPLPEFGGKFVANPSQEVKLDPRVEEQLKQYVISVAALYHPNPFHNFDHCTHVAMSVQKLLARIISPENPIHGGQQVDLRLSANDKTYGITSDKMGQFAVVFSALIHDVDHQGIPNFILAKENPDMAAQYKGKAIAEQNSVDIGWELLMEPEFQQLRECIYTTKDELVRFRQLIVNTIIATDIFDPDLAKRRKERWARAFESDGPRTLEDVSRKSTIVTEHLIQASDVAHTMQHWQVYVKWNERLFTEMYAAFVDGRMEKDPSLNWYQGELGFMDGYVIPLAMKLKECQVFGVSSDEYLNYALQNRHEWELRGQDMVAEFKKRFEQRRHSSRDL